MSRRELSSECREGACGGELRTESEERSSVGDLLVQRHALSLSRVLHTVIEQGWPLHAHPRTLCSGITMPACSGQLVPPPPPAGTDKLTPSTTTSTPISATTDTAQAPETATTAINMDRATVLQLFSRLLQDLYGTMGGPVALGELDVVAIEPAVGGQGQDNQASEVVIRFPAG